MNITKKTDNTEKEYYYSENGATVGPFNIAQLLERIGPDQLVWREGMDWTPAKDVPDLSKFFQKVVEKVHVSNPLPSYTHPSESKSKAMFSAPFSFDGRIRRMEYGISLIIYYIAIALVAALADETAVLGILFIPILWFFLAQGAKRCHDRDNSGWYQLIPFYIFWMLFAEGDKIQNTYGPPAK